MFVKDNADIDDLVHFAQADVLICSISAFSTVLSVLNTKCILHPTGTGSYNSSFNIIHYPAANGPLAMKYKYFVLNPRPFPNF